MFLPHKCNIYTVTFNTVDGATVEGKTSSYTDEPCMIYMQNSGLQDMELGRQTDLTRYRVITRDIYISIGDIIELIPKASLGAFIVETVEYHYTIKDGTVDNVYFTVRKG